MGVGSQVVGLLGHMTGPSTVVLADGVAVKFCAILDKSMTKTCFFLCLLHSDLYVKETLELELIYPSS